VVVISSELTDELVAEGLVREVVHAVQSKRKDLELEFTDRIELAFATDAPPLKTALERHLGYVAAETLATSASFGDLANADREDIVIDGHPLTVLIRRAAGSAAAEASS
jgi:isoleucyl-tRNA synthetase